MHFPDKLHFDDAGIENDIRRFILTAHYRYISSLGVIEVPSGFITDGASIPRVFWSILSPFGDYFPAAIIHDFLYSEHNTMFTRKEADKIFKEAMFNTGLPWYRRNVIHATVKIFGKSSYKGSLNNA